MSEILLSKQSINSQTLQDQYGIGIDQISAVGCVKPSMLAANTPYLIGDNPGVSQSILAQLSSSPEARQLTNLSLSYGGDNVVALAEMTAKLNEFNIGFMGASTSVYAHRVGGFAGSVKDYQAALMEYRQAVMTKSPMKAAVKQKAHAAFQKMQTQFQHELRVVSGQVKSRRGTPLTNVERATNIARSSRNVVKLNVTTQVQANNLVMFSRHAKFLGNGLAVIDFGSRIGNVHNSYQAGGNWERELFVESSSFALSAVAGSLAVKGGLGVLMLAIPFGWAALVVGGLAVAGVAAGVSIGLDSYAKENSGKLYDEIMKWINPL